MSQASLRLYSTLKQVCTSELALTARMYPGKFLLVTIGKEYVHYVEQAIQGIMHFSTNNMSRRVKLTFGLKENVEPFLVINIYFCAQLIC